MVACFVAAASVAVVTSFEVESVVGALVESSKVLPMVAVVASVVAWPLTSVIMDNMINISKFMLTCWKVYVQRKKVLAILMYEFLSQNNEGLSKRSVSFSTW